MPYGDFTLAILDKELTPSPSPLILPGRSRLDLLPANPLGNARASSDRSCDSMFGARDIQYVRGSRPGTREYRA